MAVDTLQRQVASLIEGERNAIANMANVVALLGHSLPDINWCGFYIAHQNELVLGPFWGKPACIRIPFGKGVCGTSALERKSIRVPDVELFDGHIACDAASRSELVTPIMVKGAVVAVLDIDSPTVNRFSVDDEAFAVQVASLLADGCDW